MENMNRIVKCRDWCRMMHLFPEQQPSFKAGTEVKSAIMGSVFAAENVERMSRCGYSSPVF
jgi:hypothetical protein